jgi:hypothetical protein
MCELATEVPQRRWTSWLGKPVRTVNGQPLTCLGRSEAHQHSRHGQGKTVVDHRSGEQGPKPLMATG